jgi:hypothetical protein
MRKARQTVAPKRSSTPVLKLGVAVWSAPGLVTTPDPSECEAALMMYLQLAPGKACSELAKFAFMDSDGSVAQLFIASLRKSLKPRDAVEDILVVQIALTHARLVYLSRLAADQDLRANAKVIHDACDRAANTLRRLTLALDDYRRPRKTKVFAPIRNANVAHKQVVQVNNAEIANHKRKSRSNEQGWKPATPPPVLPFENGSGLTSGGGTTLPAVALQHGSEDGRGEGAGQPQRPQTRRAQRSADRRDT